MDHPVRCGRLKVLRPSCDIGCVKAATLVALLLVTGCKSQPAICGVPQAGALAAQALASDGTSFAVALLPPAAASAGSGNNVVLSPFSAWSALAMVGVGAAGQTATQIQTVLDLPGSASSIAPAYASLACTLETDGSSNDNQLSIADSLWGQQGLAFTPSFLSTLASGYGAPLQQVDFSGDASAATTAIDQWVSTATQGQIPTLLQPSDLTGATLLVLVNALYFKGTWATGFDPSATSPMPFTLEDGSVIDVPTMSGSVSMALGGGDGFSVVELPYEGGALVIDFLIPEASLTAFEASLTAAKLESTLAALAPPTSQSLTVPKFSFSTRLTLNDVLSGLGMPDAFTPAADFSNIDGARDLSLSLVVQQATVEVDESGTVASAATGASDDVRFVAGPTQINSPFVFLIRDTTVNGILFMGHVQDPRAGS